MSSVHALLTLFHPLSLLMGKWTKVCLLCIVQFSDNLLICTIITEAWCVLLCLVDLVNNRTFIGITLVWKSKRDIYLLNTIFLSSLNSKAQHSHFGPNITLKEMRNNPPHIWVCKWGLLCIFGALNSCFKWLWGTVWYSVMPYHPLFRGDIELHASVIPSGFPSSDQLDLWDGLTIFF